MTRREFLEGLSESLKGELPEGKRQEQISYYDTYINTEMSKGNSEESVIQVLGDPRLIARTIIDAYKMSEDRGEHIYSGDYDNHSNTGDFYQDFYTKKEPIKESFAQKVMKVVWLIFGIFAFIFFIRIAVWLLFPFMIVGVILYFINRFKD